MLCIVVISRGWVKYIKLHIFAFNPADCPTFSSSYRTQLITSVDVLTNTESKKRLNVPHHNLTQCLSIFEVGNPDLYIPVQAGQ